MVHVVEGLLEKHHEMVIRQSVEDPLALPSPLYQPEVPQASDYIKQVLYERQTNTEGRILREGCLVRLEIPRIGDFEDAYGRTLAYVYLDTDGDGRYEHSFNEDLVELGLARTTDFSHEHRREFERLREQTEERGAGLWGACPDVQSYKGDGSPR